MTIGKVAELTGLPKDTLRYYEKFGLINLPKNTRGENNYRQYDRASIERLFLIKQLKNFGFTLNEIKELNRRKELDLLDCKRIEPMIKNKISKIEEQIARLQATKEKLMKAVHACAGDCMATFNTTD